MTANQTIMLLEIFRGTFKESPRLFAAVGGGPLAKDLEQLQAHGLIQRAVANSADPDPDDWDCTDRGRSLVMAMRRAMEAFLQDESRTDEPLLPKMEKAIVQGVEVWQVSDERPAYLVGNMACRQNDVRPEPALVMPPLSVYGTERSASARAIELAVQYRNLNFMVFRSLAAYRVDESGVDPRRRF